MSCRRPLADVLDVKAVVDKRRRLFLWESVRIHLDNVDDLGSFIEFEAVAPSDPDLSAEDARVRTLRAAFAIEDTNLISESYIAIWFMLPRWLRTSS
jgi:adenylate cyclase class 2